MEINPEMHKQKVGKAWAVTSFAFGILEIVFSAGIVQLIWVEESESLIYSVFGPLGDFVIVAGIVSGLFLAVPFGLLTLIFGVIALNVNKKSGTEKKVVWMATLGIVLGILGMILGILWWFLFSIHFQTGSLF